MTVPETKQNKSFVAKIFLICGVVAGPFFIFVYLIEGALREDYSPFRHPVSSLSIGPLGWIQVTNFLITGALFLAFAYGMRQLLRNSTGGLWGPILIALVGIGLIGAGIFTTDAVYGYPMDQPLQLKEYTLQGRLHSYVSLFVFVGIPVACAVFRRRFVLQRNRTWPFYCSFTAIAMIVFFILAGAGFNQVARLVECAGAFQRLSTAFGFAWTSFLALHLLKNNFVSL